MRYFVPLFALLLLTGCLQQAGGGEEKVGAILPLTGDLAVYGRNIQRGMELAVDEINAQGGINGKMLKVVYEDDGGRSVSTISAMNKLIDLDRVPAVIGAVTSSNSLAIAPIAVERGVVMISPTSTSPKLAGFKEYVFRVIASDRLQGVKLAEVALSMGYREAAVFYINNDYGLGLKDAFVEAYKQKGGKILMAESHEEGSKDFRTELTKIKGSGARAVVVVGYSKEASIFLRQGKELGLGVQWIASEGLKTGELIDLAGDATEGMVATYPGSTAGSPVYDSFREAYFNRYNEEPPIFSDYGYDALKVLAMAIRDGGYDPKGIKDALRKLRYEGATGTKAFDERGDIPYDLVSYDVWAVRGGKWVR